MGIEELRTRGAEWGIEKEPRPANRIVVTAVEAITPFGDAEQTWQAMLDGRSAVKLLDEIENFRTKIGAPLENFDPTKYFTRSEQKRYGRVTQLTTATAQSALQQAGLLDENNRLRPDIDPEDVAGWIGVAMGDMPYFLELYKALHTPGEDGLVDVARASKGSQFLYASLLFLPEQPNARTAIRHGYRGWGGNTVEACATGASNPVEGGRLLKGGEAQVVNTGGFDDALYYDRDVVTAGFSRMEVISGNNNNPQRASSPWDVERDGFVVGAGGAFLVLENLDHAIARGAEDRILAEVHGFRKSMDGGHETQLDTDNVARLIVRTLRHFRTGEYILPDAVFAHATSTKLGDVSEIDALEKALGHDLRETPITGIKGSVGHLLGGAGSLNLVMAIMALRDQVVPHTLNLTNIDPAVAGRARFVQGQPLQTPLKSVIALGYGFGGYNAGMTFKKYER